MQRSMIVLALAGVIAMPAAAQVEPKAHSPRAGGQAPPARIAMSQSPNPTVDEGTIQRISAAMLSYTVLEVQGGWPALPPAAKLALGSKGADVALLRRRLAMTEDLAAGNADGDLYDEVLAAAVRRFQFRHGLEESGSVGPKTLAALNVPVGKRLRQLAASLDRLAVMDLKFSQRYVVVNLPAAFAEAVEGDNVVHRYVVVVGKPDRPSPHRSPRSTSIRPGRCRCPS
jgi:murein L,D-transpeptidase YcbB/YkuD